MKTYLKLSLLLFCCSMLFFRCTGEKTEPIPPALRTQLSLLPDSGLGLLYINFRHILDSDIYQAFADTVFEDEFICRRLDKIVDQTDFNLKKDLNELYIAVPQQENLDDINIMLIAKGNFNKKKLVAYLKDQQAGADFSVSSYEGHELYLLDREDLVLCFADERTIVAAKTGWVKHFIDRLANHDATTSDNTWTALVSPVSYKSDFFFTLNTDKALNKFTGPDDGLDKNKPLSVLKKVKNAHLSVKLENRMHLSGSGNFGDDETAALFFDALKGAHATMKLTVSDERPVVDILNQIKISKRGSAVSVSLELTEQDIRKLKENQKHWTHFSMK